MSALSPEKKKLCELVLKEYVLMKHELAQLEAERDDIAGALPPGIVQLRGRSGNRKSDPTAGKTVKLLQLDGGHEKARRYVQTVETLLRLLDVETRRLVKWRYFQGWTADRLARKLFICPRTVHRRQSAALEMLGRLLGL